MKSIARLWHDAPNAAPFFTPASYRKELPWCCEFPVQRSTGFGSSACKGFRKSFLLINVEASAMSDKIKMRDGDTILIMVKDGEVIHHTWNMSLPHVEFVRRAAGQLPEGAWVGTASKLDGEVAAI